MDFIDNIKRDLFQINDSNFESTALKVFKYQSKNNPVYKKYIKYLGIKPENISEISNIPFLPIQFFKYHKIISGNWLPEHYFISSGTTGMRKSKHYIKDMSYYHRISKECFCQFYNDPDLYHFFMLLPSYLEQSNSSLIEMADLFIKTTKSELSDFFLYNHKELVSKLEKAKNSNRIIFLLGVSFSLLEFIENYEIDLNGAIVMETGGMKGRREEITRDELHDQLKKKMNVKHIHSEYGMTELMSQSYAREKGLFECPQWKKILIRDIYDPFEKNLVEKAGGINIIDLANLDSCCFIESQDLGLRHNNGTFEVLGRIDNSDMRGCNLLVD